MESSDSLSPPASDATDVAATEPEPEPAAAAAAVPVEEALVVSTCQQVSPPFLTARLELSAPHCSRRVPLSRRARPRCRRSPRRRCATCRVRWSWRWSRPRCRWSRRWAVTWFPRSPSRDRDTTNSQSVPGSDFGCVIFAPLGGVSSGPS